MRHYQYAIVLTAALIVGLSGCVSTELASYDFDDLAMTVDARVAPDAEIDASYSIVVDPDDPVRTALSIGSSLAKANQVAQVESKLREALRETDMRAIVEDELVEFVQTTFDARVVENRRAADLQLLIDVESYGIDAGGPGSGIEFQLSAVAMLFDLRSGDRIWRTSESVSEPVSGDVFGLPPVAGNVLSAVRLSELTEKEIADGLERLARDAAWDIGLELERDIYRAHRALD
ncbi:MAG: hypothetical protein KOO61_02110 [Spirochaetales bacterium]|nr:hypothetical protein [Spirochaetales bacterium]